MREGKTVVVEMAGVEVGVTITDEDFELEEIPKDAVDEGIKIADEELSN